MILKSLMLCTAAFVNSLLLFSIKVELYLLIYCLFMYCLNFQRSCSRINLTQIDSKTVSVGFVVMI